MPIGVVEFLLVATGLFQVGILLQNLAPTVTQIRPANMPNQPPPDAAAKIIRDTLVVKGVKSESGGFTDSFLKKLIREGRSGMNGQISLTPKGIARSPKALPLR